jgi:hypothetical protein
MENEEAEREGVETVQVLVVDYVSGLFAFES